MNALRGLFASVALAASATAASAQVNFVGSTSFQFNGVGGFTPTATFQGLTVNSGTFNIFTSGPGVTQGWSNGGTLKLAFPPRYDYTGSGTSLDMRVTFSSPTAAFQTFDADVSGKIITKGNGVVVSFNNSPVTNIPYSVPGASGTFQLSVFDFGATANASQPSAITGSIKEQSFIQAVTPTPEPASMGLLATGLIGFAAARRKKKNASA